MVYHPNEYCVPSFNQTKDNHYKQFVRQVTENPDNGSHLPFKKKLEEFFPAPEPINSVPVESLSDLLQTNFVVGEAHQDRAPKNFLIQNMTKFKEAGFTTLFLEHLYYDDQQEMDDYDPASAEHSEAMENRLSELDAGFSISSNRNKDHNEECQCHECQYLLGNNFLELVIVAKQCGIRVVGIDTEYTYSEQYDSEHHEFAYGGPTGFTRDNFRIKSMNYTATKIIEKETQEHPGKWFGLMGRRHCHSQDDNIQGVPQLTGAKTVIIETQKNLDEVRVAFNSIVTDVEQNSFFKIHGKKTHHVPYTVIIETPRNQLTPIISALEVLPIHEKADTKTSQEETIQTLIGNSGNVTIEEMPQEEEIPSLEPATEENQEIALAPEVNLPKMDGNQNPGNNNWNVIIEDGVEDEEEQGFSLVFKAEVVENTQSEKTKEAGTHGSPSPEVVSQIPVIGITATPHVSSESYNQIMEKITSFETYLVKTYESQKDIAINEDFIKKAKAICNRWDSGISKLNVSNPFEFKRIVCEEIANEAQNHFHHRHAIIRALADLVFIPLGLVTGGLLFIAKAAMTGSLTFFVDKPTNREDELNKCLYDDLYKPLHLS